MQYINPYFICLSDHNKSELKPASKNRVIVSSLNTLYASSGTGSYCLALVKDGTENYEINKKTYRLNKNQFLSFFPQEPAYCIIDSKTPVDGICLSIDYTTILDSFNILSSKKIDLDNSLSGYFHSPLFFENVNMAESSELGKYLLSIDSLNLSDITEEWFIALAEKIVLHENKNLRGLYSLSSLQAATKKEVLKRLYIAREFIDANFKRKIGINEIAQACALSKFHFYRTFKEVFKISPHQYLIQKRLVYAYAKIHNSQIKVSDIALETGFADIHSFSKSFKKYFNISPTRLLASD